MTTAARGDLRERRARTYLRERRARTHLRERRARRRYAWASVAYVLLIALPSSEPLPEGGEGFVVTRVESLPAGPAGAWVLWGLATVAAIVAVVLRRRHPWLLAAIGILGAAVVTENILPLGLFALAIRRRDATTVAAMVLGAAALALPWVPLTTPLSLQAPEDAGRHASWADWAVRVAILVVIPVTVGAYVGLRREARQAARDQRVRDQKQAAHEAVLEERARIAREMHDVLGHKLSLITMQAGALEVNAGAPAEVVERQAGLLRSSGKEALDELRAILGVLNRSDAARDPDPEQMHPHVGLPEIEDMVARSRATGVEVDLVAELARPLPPTLARAAHRVVQESLTNAFRHAPHAAIAVTLRGPGEPVPAFAAAQESPSRDHAWLTVEVLNGPTSHPDQGPGAGRGLPGLHERVEALGGTLDTVPTADGGFRVRARIPWPSPEQAEDAS